VWHRRGCRFLKRVALADVVRGAAEGAGGAGPRMRRGGWCRGYRRGNERATAVVMPKAWTIPMGGARAAFSGDRPIGTILNGVRYFFVEIAEYFDSRWIVWWEQRRLSDNPERYTEFCRAAMRLQDVGGGWIMP